MPISLVAGSADFSITQRPRVNLPAVNGSSMLFTSTPLIADGTCSLTGESGDDPAGWTLGIIQLQWVETNWGYYRGAVNSDGSCFVQRARPPARPAQACRDTMVPGAVLVDNSISGRDKTVVPRGTSLPVRLSARLSDDPIEYFDLSRTNSRTGRLNYLQEVQLEFHFCTILTLVSPDRRYEHLKHLFWNVHWQARFERSSASSPTASWGIHATRGHRANSANVAAVVSGGPNDHRFRGVLTTPAAPNCNAVAERASSAPNVRESPTWSNFDVRH
jgi:hypothetical protein